MARGTVTSTVALETWTSLVKAGLGAAGLVLLASGPLMPTPEAFPYLPHYSYVLGGVLVLVAATMRLRSMLIVLGCLALTAALALTLAGGNDGDLNLAALLLYGAAAVIFGAIARGLWMFVPFLLIPLLVVAPHGSGWGESRDAFADAWADALDCSCPLAGLPASLAVVGAAIGRFRTHGWPEVRPSGVPLLIACAGLLMAGLVLGSLIPAGLGIYRMVALRVALLSGVLGWVVFAYHVGRLSLVWEAATACLLLLAGALYVDRATSFPEDLGPTLGITVATSLLPAVLAGVGLLGRAWIGKERPKVDQAILAQGRRTATEAAFLARPPTAYHTGTSGPPVAPSKAPAPPAAPPPGASPDQEPEPGQPETPPTPPTPAPRDPEPPGPSP